MVPKISVSTIFSMARRISSILWILFWAATSLKCQSIQYYNQAINGEMDILRARQSISKLVDDPATPPLLRQKLLFILSIRAFAEKNLHLPVDDHYLSYGLVMLN